MSPIAGFFNDDNKVFCHEEGEMDVLHSKEREREKTGAFVVLLFLVGDDDNLIEKNVLILLFSSFLFQLVFLGLFFFSFYYYSIFSAQKLAEAHKGLSRAIKKLFPCRNSSPAEIVAVRLPG